MMIGTTDGKRDYSLESPSARTTSSVGARINSEKGPKQQQQQKTSLVHVLKSKLFIGVVVVCVVCITLLCIGLVSTYERDNDITLTIDAWNDKLSGEQLFWFESGLNDLKHALGQSTNSRRAKNVILFVADGMGPSTVTAARIFKEKEEGHLLWERFPHMGLLKVCVV